MATVRVTVTLSEEQLRAIRDLVRAGGTPSVSAFLQHAVSVALDDVAGWRALLEAGLQESGGPLTAAEQAWADQVLGGTPPAA